MKKHFSAHLGWPLLLTLSGIPIVMWIFMIPVHDRYGTAYLDLTSLGRLTGIATIVFFCFNLILTTRLRFIENLFGGLNKMFIAHHIIGGSALIFALIHSLALTLRLTSVSFKQAALLTIPGTTDWPTTYGVIGLYGFIVLMIITFYLSLPYRIWLFTHKFLGLVFVFIALHVILASSDTTTNHYLKWYLIGLICLASVSYIYRTLLPRFFARRYKYQVASVQEVSPGTARITMLPVGRRLDFTSGQFVFVSFRMNGFSREWHPFSISSNSAGEGLCITVKSLGKYTGALVKMSSNIRGEEVWIEGAYGRFNFRNFHAKHQVWVAGGIGITPFLSMVPDVKPDYKVDLYYSVKSQAELIDLPIMQQWAAASQNSLRIIPLISERDGQITAEKIKQYSGDLSGSEILLCGPPPMMHALRDQFKHMGVKKRTIHAEEFALT
jgi:predicted ferric reductase